MPGTVVEEEKEEETHSQDSQLDLFPSLGEDEVIVGDTLNDGGSHVTGNELQLIRVYPK